MNWVRIDGAFPHHPKVMGLSDAALAAWLKAVCYAGQWETDGHVPDNVVRTIAKAKTRSELERAGLWHQNGAGIVIHDYLEWNPPKSYLDELREKRSDAGKKGAAAKWKRGESSA